MKKSFLLCCLLSLLALAFTGCGAARCTARELADCVNSYSSCSTSCGASDTACQDQCTTSYCSCLSDHGCDKASSCK